MYVVVRNYHVSNCSQLCQFLKKDRTRESVTRKSDNQLVEEQDSNKSKIMIRSRTRKCNPLQMNNQACVMSTILPCIVQITNVAAVRNKRFYLNVSNSCSSPNKLSFIS